VADPVQFDVPARVEYVGLLRMLVSSLAADRRDVDDEQLDDLRLAVSEACNLVVDSGAPHRPPTDSGAPHRPSTDNAPESKRRLVVSCREDAEALILDVHDGTDTRLPSTGDTGGGLPPPERLDEDDLLPLELIRALIDDVSKVTEDGVERIRLRIVCPPAPPYRAV
jgi:hypothetical protein